jgi:PKD repeat protein
MKKLLLLLSIIFMSALAVSAQTMSVHVSGTVKLEPTGFPVPNHEVIIMADSSNGFSFYATRNTNPNGFYDCTIQNVPVGSPVTFIVKTLDCENIYQQESFLSTESPEVVNFEICTSSTDCEAQFTYYHDPTNLFNYHFTSTSTIPTGSSIISYDWDFGDSTAHGTTQDPWHIYAVEGEYNVCLTITTSIGCTNTGCEEINIEQQGGECEAAFEYERDSSNLLMFHFFDVSSIPPGNTITSRSWDFGDGTPLATTPDPWHTYASPGEYHVCLSITTNTGCTSTECEDVHAGIDPPNCKNWITFTKNNLTVSFEGHTHSSYPSTWAWNFDDPASGVNNTSNLQAPQHIYSLPGIYHVTLHTVDSTGCENTSFRNICFYGGAVNLHGVVNAGNNIVDHGYIELIKVDSNNVMTVVDSQVFGDSSAMYWFAGVQPGNYYLKAELLPTSVYYGQYVPTYYEEALNWTEAQLIELGEPENPYCFGLLHVDGPSSGNGNISGTITSGVKVNSGGTPAANVEVLLLDGQNNALSYVKTNQNGQFEFPNVAMGSYVVWPEVAGSLTTPAHITLNATSPAVILPFSMTSSNVVYGINDNLPDYFSKIGEIFPNPPVNGIAYINVTVTRDLTIDLILYNLTGQVIRNSQAVVHDGDNQLRFNVENLAKGSYYLKLHSSEGGTVVKKLTIMK